MDTLTLTDDEAVAIAATLAGDWRAPLPTIDTASKDDMARALFRGRRSLVIRDLAESDGTPLAAAAELRKRMNTGLRAFFILADAVGNWLPHGISVYLYGPSVDAVELSHVVAAAGVHYFRIAPPPGLWAALTDLAQAVYTDGFANPPATLATAPPPPAGAPDRSPSAAFLHVVAGNGIRSVKIAKGAISTGRGPVPAPFPSLEAATTWLLS